MSIRDQIGWLERLSSVDLEIRRMDEELSKHRGGIDGLMSEVAALEQRIKTDKDAQAGMEKTRGELSIELRQMTQQVERSREKLARSRNEREQNASQRELEELRKLIRDREDEIERVSQLAEAARVSIAEAEAKHKELSDSLAGSSEGVAATIAELERDRGQRSTERADFVKHLPVVLYRRYESIRTRRPAAIASTHDGTCNGCHMSIPPMMFQKLLRLQEFEQCPNCRRILYYAPAPAADKTADKSSS